MIKKLIVFVILLISFSFSTVSYAQAAETDSSIQADFTNKVFDITLTNGKNLFDAEEDVREREDLNDKIYYGKDVGNISLFDRFGGNLLFVPYYGERKFTLNLVDTFYSKIIDGQEEFSFKLEDLWSDRDAQINNIVYDGRADVISEIDYSTGKKDPRRETYSSLSSVGGEAAIGNFWLTISNNITSVVSYLSGNELYDSIQDIWDSVLESSAFDWFSGIIKILIVIVLCFFVIRLIKEAISIINGHTSIGKLLMNTLSVLISVGIVFTFANNPTILSNTMGNAVGAIDGIFTEVINEGSNEVINSDNEKYVIHATLWSKSILDPWCKGMFDGAKYDELYTQFDTSENTKLDQSNQDISGYYDKDEVKYNSAAITGDISVPLNKNRDIKNWAALVWSTQSIYHINAVNNTSTPGYSDSSWPRAERTPNNSQIFVDSFRWLDAKLNISPGYTSPTESINDYLDAREYKTNFVFAGYESIFLSLLMCMMLYPIFRRLYSLLMVVIIGVRMIINSIAYVFNLRSDFSPLENIKKAFKPLYHYFWWSMILYIMIILYKDLVGSILGNLAFALLAIILIKAKPITNTRQLMEAKIWMKKKANLIKSKAQNAWSKVRG